ncbi:A disintegrin and metalloproteinase with thrombospondin motifs 16-like [Octopus sinensis]|uniref:A disintegrin and metalloproteinase with thrombospondin motifs 16-like n=1 Tax=Octopus sinensis TaxID=2607531 RepID=A0A7E6FU51_9MOLL|nr:A disintegrin and metalloproteinase with thrombospondin motifs 16-like [Octopus sinensis]
MPNNNSKKESSLDVQMEENIETNNVRACFYRGSLIGEDDSYAALSICGGLSGIIQTSLGDFIIQPYPDSKEASSTKYGFTKGAKDNRVPLILYRMSSLRDVYHDLTNDFHHKHQHHKRRTRRSSGRIYYNPNRRYTVELFVVVDKEALVKIQHINPTTFVLNLFNMVGMYYAQKSLGIQVHIAVTDILFMRRNEPEIIYRKGPGYTLNNFCRWIYDQRYRRQQFDHAVLLTGQKMCPGTHCNSVGYGRIGDMCMERSSCSLVRLRGLHSALIAAHEIGHSFGLEHDHPLVNGCNPSEETIMKPQITKHTEHYVWSHCSRDSLHKFLRSKDSFCLLKTSDRHYRHFDDKLPGENYEADMQCKLRHGPEYRYCSDLTTIDLCSQLWCVKGNQPCNSGLFPAAAGTPCGRSVFDKSRGSPQLWCLDYKCVPKDPNFKFKDLENFQGSYINGYWENWSAWSGCPTECGGGIRMRTRLCLKRQHQIGKPRCNGPSVEQGVCNLNKCRPGIPDPREKQCRSFNGKVYMGARWIWSAYREFNFGKKQCMLYCVNNNDNKAHRMRYAVDDGTLCNTISNDVCIKGVCTHVGCDLQLNSTARLDRCCVCGGDGSSCTFTRTTFNAQGKMYGIVDLVVLPEGACSVTITERSVTKNSLAIANVARTYQFNYRGNIDEGKHILNGQSISYKKTRGYNIYKTMDSIKIEGPLKESIKVQLYYVERNPGVVVSYSKPKSHSKSFPRLHHGVPYSALKPVSTGYLPPMIYKWMDVVEKECSNKCGTGGERIINNKCKSVWTKEVVNSTLCRSLPRPAPRKFKCPRKECPPRWVAGAWTLCSKKCGTGKQKRKLYCKQKTALGFDKHIQKELCLKLKKPVRSRNCNNQPCKAKWRASKWSSCSVTCGKGYKRRRVDCMQKVNRRWTAMPETVCSHSHKPQSTRTCRTRKKCPKTKRYQWVASAWGECSKSCGYGGLQRKILRCTRYDRKTNSLTPKPNKNCQHIPKPKMILTRKCAQQNECSKWTVSSWTRCSQSCGMYGVQTRAVKCVVNEHWQVNPLRCRQSQKPQTKQRCNTFACPTASLESSCTDVMGWCYVAVARNMCESPLIKKRCCKSCSTREQ